MKGKKAVIFMVALGILLWYNVKCQQEITQLYCRRHLSSALAILCYNGFLVKRSGPPMALNAVAYLHKPSSWPGVPSHRAHLMMDQRLEDASECCEKPCSIDELMTC